MPAASGFTLIEVLAALVVFAAGALLSAGLSQALSTQVERAAVRTEIVGLAQERLEEMERLPFDSLSVGSGSESLDVRGIPYARRWSVSGAYPRTYEVEVRVGPADGDDGGPSHTLRSYVFEPW